MNGKTRSEAFLELPSNTFKELYAPSTEEERLEEQKRMNAERSRQYNANWRNQDEVVERLCDKAWEMLETTFTTIPILEALNKHDRGEQLSSHEIKTVKWFVDQYKE